VSDWQGYISSGQSPVAVNYFEQQVNIFFGIEKMK
jgi:hypothetical protein